MLDYFKTAMEAQFGKDSTTINYDEASVSVKSVTNMYAVSSPEFTGWKFLNDDNNMGTLAKTIIPEDVISALKIKEKNCNKKNEKGILLVNLGSPDSPNPKDVKKYLGEFLMDERVIDVPLWARTLLVKGIILNTRPKASAKAYQKFGGKKVRH